MEKEYYFGLFSRFETDITNDAHGIDLRISRSGAYQSLCEKIQKNKELVYLHVGSYFLEEKNLQTNISGVQKTLEIAWVVLIQTINPEESDNSFKNLKTKAIEDLKAALL